MRSGTTGGRPSLTRHPGRASEPKIANISRRGFPEARVVLSPRNVAALGSYSEFNPEAMDKTPAPNCNALSPLALPSTIVSCKACFHPCPVLTADCPEKIGCGAYSCLDCGPCSIIKARRPSPGTMKYPQDFNVLALHTIRYEVGRPRYN